MNLSPLHIFTSAMLTVMFLLFRAFIPTLWVVAVSPHYPHKSHYRVIYHKGLTVWRDCARGTREREVITLGLWRFTHLPHIHAEISLQALQSIAGCQFRRLK